MKLLFGQDAAVAAWVAARIPHASTGFGQCFAIGVVDDTGIRAGVVFHAWTPGNCEISMAADTPRWAQRGLIRAMLHYPFEQQACRRVTVVIPHDGARAIRFCAGLGFVREGVVRHLYAEKRHGVVMGLLRKDYHRMLKGA